MMLSELMEESKKLRLVKAMCKAVNIRHNLRLAGLDESDIDRVVNLAVKEINANGDIGHKPFPGRNNSRTANLVNQVYSLISLSMVRTYDQEETEARFMVDMALKGLGARRPG